MATDEEKWYISIFSAIMFYVIASPEVYKITGTIFHNLTGVTIQKNGKPNNLGLLIHTVIFMLLTRYSIDMNIFAKKNEI